MVGVCVVWFGGFPIWIACGFAYGLLLTGGMRVDCDFGVYWLPIWVVFCFDVWISMRCGMRLVLVVF